MWTGGKMRLPAGPRLAECRGAVRRAAGAAALHPLRRARPAAFPAGRPFLEIRRKAAEDRHRAARFPRPACARLEPRRRDRRGDPQDEGADLRSARQARKRYLFRPEAERHGRGALPRRRRSPRRRGDECVARREHGQRDQGRCRHGHHRKAASAGRRIQLRQFARAGFVPRGERRRIRRGEDHDPRALLHRRTR